MVLAPCGARGSAARVMSVVAPPLLAAPPARYEQLRWPLPDGTHTTLHLASFQRSRMQARVVRLEEPAPLAKYCARRGIPHALVGGFYRRRDMQPLGELRLSGLKQAHVPFTAPWHATRACLHLHSDAVSIEWRDVLANAPPGDLLQAGPMLVRNRRPVLGSDPEGFSTGAEQFDSDITDGRHPRAALGVDGERLLAVVCDGRGPDESGMTLGELSQALVGLGAERALNLNGGGSASLVCDGHLRNRPREQHGLDLPDGRAVPTAIVFLER